MSYTFSFDAASLIQGLNIQLKVSLGDALERTANQLSADWQERIYRAPGIYSALKDRYYASVKYSVDRDNLRARIFSDDPMAGPIETGIPARDLKRALDTSVKVRVAAKGKHAGQRYLIIPFRHNTPGNTALARAMPQAVFDEAQKLTKSRVLDKIPMRSGLNASDIKTHGPLMTMRNTYQWGDRLQSGLAPKLKPQHATDIYAGMVRFDTSSGKQKYSEYLTFRVMGEWSNGWIAPAQPGRYIIKAVSEQAQEILNNEVTAAIATTAGV